MTRTLMKPQKPFTYEENYSGDSDWFIALKAKIQPNYKGLHVMQSGYTTRELHFDNIPDIIDVGITFIHKQNLN